MIVVDAAISVADVTSSTRSDGGDERDLGAELQPSEWQTQCVTWI